MAEREPKPIDVERQRWTLDSRLLAGLVCSVVVATWWIRDGTEEVGRRIGRVELSLERLTDTVSRQGTLAEAALLRRESMAWLATFKAANPTLVVPDLPPR